MENALADSLAKQAAISSSAMIHQCTSLQPADLICAPSFIDVVDMQNCADDRELNIWFHKGCSCGLESGLWLQPRWWSFFSPPCA